MSITKKDLMELLENNSVYKAALKNVSSDQQEHIKKLMDNYMENATKKLLPFLQKLDEDPELAENVRNKLRKDAGLSDGVINIEEPITGSKVD